MSTYAKSELLDGALTIEVWTDTGPLWWTDRWTGPLGEMQWTCVPSDDRRCEDARGVLRLHTGSEADLGIIPEGADYPREAIRSILGDELFKQWTAGLAEQVRAS